MLHPTSSGKALWLGFFMATSLFVSPCLWLLARELTEQKALSIKTIPALHKAFILVGLLLLIPLLQTAHWGTGYADPEYVASADQSLFIHSTMLACIAIFLMQVPYYLTQCIRILLKHSTQQNVLFVKKLTPSMNTLRMLILVVCTNWFVGLLRTLHCVFLGQDTGLGVVFVVLEVAFTLLALALLLKQTTVFTIEGGLVANALGNIPKGDDAGASYSKSSLNTTIRNRVANKINEALTKQKVFRDNRLGLRELCQLINENPHYVSQVINQDLNTNFYDLINSHRIEYAKSVLEKSPSQSIIDIALDAGYNSKSTFNAAFRRHAAMTPTDYRRARYATSHES